MLSELKESIELILINIFKINTIIFFDVIEETRYRRLQNLHLNLNDDLRCTYSVLSNFSFSMSKTSLLFLQFPHHIVEYPSQIKKMQRCAINILADKKLKFIFSNICGGSVSTVTDICSHKY